MRYERWGLLFGLFVIEAAACGGDPVGEEGAPHHAPDLDASTAPNPAGSACGTSADLPPRTVRDDAQHAITVECDGDAEALAITVLDDGIVRMRYGRKDDRGGGGSIVALAPLPSTRALAAGRRDNAVMVCTSELEIAIEPGRCKVHVKDLATGAAIIEDGADDGFFHSPDGVGVTRSSPESERFYGLGLHSAAGTSATSARGLDLRGSSIELYNTDAYDPVAGGFPPNAAHLYETIPFYIGLRGATAYGVFTDETRRTRFDLAAQDKGRTRTTSFGASRVDQYVVAGPRIAEVVRRYTQITGRTPLPAPWSLGFHQSRWEGPCDGSPPPAERPFCSASQIAAVAKRFRDSKIPADGIFLDIQHMNGYRSFTFDGARFANPEGLVSELDALGFKTQIIVDPGIKIDPAWDVYKSGIDASHFLKTSTGAVFEGEVWPGPAVFPDFSAPKTRTWWSALAEQAAKRGIRGLWIDMNEPSSFKTGGGTVPDDVVVEGDGRGVTTMAELHNAYALFEAKATYEGMKAAHPDERPFVLSRAAFAGQQKWSAVWTGDAPSTWTTLAATLPQLLHLGLSGMAFSGSDVGGYSGRAESTPELFSRWMSLGAISPFFRAHAERDARRQEPWAFGPEVEDATRDLVSIRYELMPYLYSAFDETQRTGAPVLRPLVFDFQDDEKTHVISDEAMLGSQILVAPVLTPAAGAGRSIYLPKSSSLSRWFELRSGAVYEGGRTINVTSGIPTEGLPKSALPLFAREGAIIPRTEVGSRVGEKPVLIVDVFPAAETKTSFTLYEDDGKLAPSSSRVTFTLERTATGARLSASAREGTWVGPQSQIVVRFRRIDHAPTSSAGVTWDPVDRSASVTLPNQFPFAIDLAYDAKLEPEGDVAVPITIKLPPGTPTTTAIHVASSRTGWTHAPLATRIGDEATGTVPVTRGGWAFVKITRGGWPTVEKDATCAEISNRAVFGSATPLKAIEVKRWADLCP